MEAVKCRVLSLDGGRSGGGAACGVGLPVHVDEVRSGGVNNKVQKSEHLALHKTFVMSKKSKSLSHPGGNVGVHPVLVLLVFPVHEPDQDRDKCREVEECSAGSEPELLISDPIEINYGKKPDTYHHQPVDSEFVEGLSKTEVVEAEEDRPEEADADHSEEPVLAVHIGGGRAHDAEESKDLNIAV